MKKLLCTLLITLLCLWSLIGCPASAPEPEPLTAADIVTTVNETVNTLNATDFSTLDPSTMTGETASLDELISQLKTFEGQVSIRTVGTENETLYAVKNGILYSLTYYDQYVVLIGDMLAQLTCWDNGLTHAEAEYLPFSSLLEESLGGSATENPLASVKLSLPLMTEQDILADGQTFTIQNSYITSLIKAAFSGLPEEIMDAETLASIRTMLPGLIDNLGLRVTLQAKGAAVVGYEIAFDANGDFNALLGLSTETAVKGRYAVNMTDDGLHMKDLALEAEIGGELTLAFTVDAAYTDAVLNTVTVEMDMDILDEELDLLYGNSAYYSLRGDQQIDMSFTITPGALQAGSAQDARLIEGSLKTAMANGAIYEDGVLTSEPDAIGQSMLNSMSTMGSEITVFSRKTGEGESTVSILMEEGTVEVAITVGSAPDFKPVPEAGAALLDELYGAYYKELLATVDAAGARGIFHFVTEDGYMLSFRRGVKGEGSFLVMPYNNSAPGYSREITYKNGEYTIHELP